MFRRRFVLAALGLFHYASDSDRETANLKLAEGQHIRLPDADEFVVIDDVISKDGGCKIYVNDSYGVRPVYISAEDLARVEVLEEDGGADSRKVLAALWCEWMRQVMSRSKATARDVSCTWPGRW